MSMKEESTDWTNLKDNKDLPTIGSDHKNTPTHQVGIQDEKIPQIDTPEIPHPSARAIEEQISLECCEPMTIPFISTPELMSVGFPHHINMNTTLAALQSDMDEGVARSRKMSTSSAFIPVARSPHLKPCSPLTPPQKLAPGNLLVPPDDLPLSLGTSVKRKQGKSGKTVSTFCLTASDDEPRAKATNGLLALIQAVTEMEGKTKAAPKPGAANGHAQTPCGNKLCTEIRPKDTPDDGWMRRKFGEKYLWMCPKCNEAYGKKQFCEHCRQVYRDTAEHDAVVDGLDWIECDRCSRWTHIRCIEEKACKDIQTLLLDPLFKYICSACEKVTRCGKRGTKKKKRQERDHFAQ